MNAVRPFLKLSPAKRVSHLVVLERGGETYWFRFYESRAGEAIQATGRWAANPELSLTWFEAAVLTTKIRSMVHRDQPDAVLTSPELAFVDPSVRPPAAPSKKSRRRDFKAFVKNLLAEIQRGLSVLGVSVW